MPHQELKNDLNRIGVFSELGYISINDPYVPSKNKPFNDAASKGKQMLPGGNKTRSALQSGYFDKSFPRILEGESYNDPVKRKRQQRIDEAKKNVGNTFMPSHSGKVPSGAGSHYGTFSGPVQTFSPVARPGASYRSPGRNFVTNPSKKGTGFGYSNVFIGKPHTYSSEPYDRARELSKKEMQDGKKRATGGPFRLSMYPRDLFDSNPYKIDKTFPEKPTKSKKGGLRPFKPSSPGKELGGNKAGCFEHYPTHSDDPYAVSRNPFRESQKGAARGVFKPSQGPKSTPYKSIVNQNVDRRINRLNFRNSHAVTA